MKDRDARILSMNLQFFAEENGAGQEEGSGTGDEETQGQGGSGEADKKDIPDNGLKSFDDILSQKEYQAEFDRRIQKALETQKSKLEVLFDEKATEAEKLAKMTKEEKIQYQYQKKVKELEDKEAAITKRELMAEAKNTLAEKSIPSALAEILDYSDADSCKRSIVSLETAFRSAVEKGIEEKLKGGKPPKNAAEQNDTNLADQVEALMMGR